ncbi:nucleolar complex protein 14 [Irineochytrium annulatum]|nr:nucleolar complex protein 14 [Irineochytrium annulatum]
MTALLSKQRVEKDVPLKATSPSTMTSSVTFPSVIRRSQIGTAYDVHIYFTLDQIDFARELHATVAKEFPDMKLFRVHEKPIGPHPMPMFEVNIATPEQFAAFVPWIEFARGPLSVLVHPHTGDAVADHSTHAIWIGDKVAVDIEMLKRFAPPSRFLERERLHMAKTKNTGGSALKKMRTTLKTAGVIGKPQAKKAKTSAAKASISASKRESRKTMQEIATDAQSRNPFEFQFSRQKHPVLGRKVKGVAGKPMKQRKKAEENRKKTLEVEMDRRSKVSNFVDRRFGENDPSMSLEDKMMERLLKEKHGRNDRSADFNLEEDLTHMGQSLSGLDDFNDAGLELVDSDDDRGQIDKDTVKYDHFGGFGETEDPDRRKSRNEIMQEVIAKSKHHKVERQKQNEEVHKLADEVDADLDDIRSLLMNSESAREARQARARDRALPSQLDEYDRFMMELKEQPRGVPSNRLKTEEEIAMEEKEKLERMEAARRKRMLGDEDDDDEEENGDGDGDEEEDNGRKRKKTKEGMSKKRARPSQADDLDDDYLNPVAAQSAGVGARPLEYKDGVLVNNEIFMKKPTKRSKKAEAEEEEVLVLEEDNDVDESGDEDDGDDEEEEEGDGAITADDDDEEEEHGAEANGPVRVRKRRALDANEDDEDENADVLGDDDEGDAEEDDGESSEAEEAEQESRVSNGKRKKAKAMDEEAENSTIPFTFEAPETIEQLRETLAGYAPEEQATIIQRIRVLFHVKLGGANRAKLQKLLVLLLQYMDGLVTQTPPDVASFKALRVHAFELTKQFAEKSGEFFMQRLKRIMARMEKFKIKKQYALPLQDVAMLRMISQMFSTSDRKHPVCSPAAVIMVEFLNRCHFMDGRQSLCALFICEILHDFNKLSKRYVPDVIYFLHTLIPKLIREITAKKAWNSTTQELSILSLGKKTDPEEFFTTNSFRISLLAVAIDLLKSYSHLYNELPSYIEIFTPFVTVLESMPMVSIKDATLREIVTQTLAKTKQFLSTSLLKRKPLQLQKRKAVAIPTYAPKFQENYSLDRRYDQNRERAQEKKLKAEYKKEFKGATRELRKDGKFIARKRLEEKIVATAQYHKRMKQIVGSLGEQEGEMRNLEKMAGKERK